MPQSLSYLILLYHQGMKRSSHDIVIAQLLISFTQSFRNLVSRDKKTKFQPLLFGIFCQHKMSIKHVNRLRLIWFTAIGCRLLDISITKNITSDGFKDKHPKTSWTQSIPVLIHCGCWITNKTDNLGSEMHHQTGLSPALLKFCQSF